MDDAAEDEDGRVGEAAIRAAAKAAAAADGPPGIGGGGRAMREDIRGESLGDNEPSAECG